ncbi:feline leukemia virus subgroup C receptor-related protein 2 [Caerostris extrusa]|uniref:Feline leukemia virus subgroup C receptor-related protein 2 n=1 Tax=Caerostris extrusa TaxID=172846 RepID=A0AAV4M9M0_CAEEX|nr:feline leukemia virus subgroup C receptor-related protein 2 [Caerostris extrusa]
MSWSVVSLHHCPIYLSWLYLPVLAAKWFPSQELSTACAFGVFGNQLGIALGFILPTQIVSNECSQKDLISHGKGNLAIILSSVNIVVFILIVFTFQNAPKFPPSISEAHKKKEDDQSHFQVVLSMIKNRDFILVFIMYGMMVGCFFAMSTNLNNLVLHFSHTKSRNWLDGFAFHFCWIGRVHDFWLPFGLHSQIQRNSIFRVRGQFYYMPCVQCMPIFGSYLDSVSHYLFIYG